MTVRRAGLLVLFVLMAVLHTWPLASDIGGLSRLDNDDTALNVWAISWVAHIIPRNPASFFDAPIFYPEHRTFAYSEHMLVPGLIGAPLSWAGVDPVIVYNLLVIAGLALSGWAMCLLIISWTGSTAAGIVAGLLYGFNAHLLTRFAHLQALHVEFLPLTLWAFDRVVTGWPGTDRETGGGRRAAAALLLAAAFVLQALCSNYTFVFLSAALLVAAVVRADEWLWPWRADRVRALMLAAAVAVAVMFPFLWPYYEVSREQGLARSIDEVRLYSAGLLDYLTTGGRLHYDWWSHRFFEGRTALFPGVTAMALTVFALSHATLRRDPRVRMAVAIGIAGVALSFGPALPGYAWLHAHVPLLQGLRAAGRWGFLLLTGVAILAGYGVAALEALYRRSPYWLASVLAIMALITLEALRAPMSLVPVTPVPAIYAQVGAASGPLVELPYYGGMSVSENARYMVAAAQHFRPLVNGYSGFEPASSRERAERWRAFPAASVLDEMRALGVRHVMLHLAGVSDTVRDQVAAESALTLVADDGARRLYALQP
ncbi:MAG: hypothetical protein IT178_02110 [Acidobacteria bacterium]|nr:hypothetical protein [Acidobacteriota bacterium]